MRRKTSSCIATAPFRALGARCGHAPAQLGNTGVEIVLREEHVTHEAVWNPGHVLAPAPNGHIREIVVRVRRRAIIEGTCGPMQYARRIVGMIWRSSTPRRATAPSHRGRVGRSYSTARPVCARRIVTSAHRRYQSSVRHTCWFSSLNQLSSCTVHARSASIAWASPVDCPPRTSRRPDPQSICPPSA